MILEQINSILLEWHSCSMSAFSSSFPSFFKYSWFTVYSQFQVYSKEIQFIYIYNILFQIFFSHIRSVQLLSCVWFFVAPWSAARQASLSITNSWSLIKLMSIELVMPSDHLILCHPLLLLPSIFPSIRVFSSKSVLCIRWPKDWIFCFSISPSGEYLGLISFRINWLDLLAVQGTLKSLLQHHSFKSINSLALSFLYSPTLTSSHDYWKNRNFD